MKEESKTDGAGLVRSVFYTDEFKEFYNNLEEKARKKFDYVIVLIKDLKLIHTDFVKKLVNTELYEMRISIGTNEYRSVIFSLDHANVLEATQVIIINGFLKKSSKDYDKQIKKAIRILNDLEL